VIFNQNGCRVHSTGCLKEITHDRGPSCPPCTNATKNIKRDRYPKFFGEQEVEVETVNKQDDPDISLTLPSSKCNHSKLTPEEKETRLKNQSTYIKKLQRRIAMSKIRKLRAKLSDKKAQIEIADDDALKYWIDQLIGPQNEKVIRNAWVTRLESSTWRVATAHSILLSLPVHFARYHTCHETLVD
jgi:hypothetical protein